ncbi:P-loop containing nucleoside triphosphate hydrolase protein [Lipomyces oligophaga]|uniref:P-loop containing nucleoside triphosphate hydrolase protein n=1 Tax=Lipomyces oligophaga TaxID=45792 RepID=UPI0034CFF222
MALLSARVAYTPLRTSFVNLPPSVVSLLVNSEVVIQNVIIELNFVNSLGKSATAFAGWSGFSSTKSDLANGSNWVEVDPLFAKSVLLPEDIKVDVKFHTDLPDVSVVNLEPASPEDWETVELHTQFLESNMLSQIRAVSKSQPIVVYMSSYATATLNISSTDPPIPASIGFAKIAPKSEIIVAPVIRKTPTAKLKDKSVTKTTSSGLKTGGSRRLKDSPGPSVMLKGVPLPHPFFDMDESFDFDNSSHNSKLALYVDLESVSHVLKTAHYGLISIFQPPRLITSTSKPSTSQVQQESEESADLLNSQIASKIVAEVTHFENIPSGYAALSPNLANALKLDSAAVTLIRLETAPRPLSKLPKRVFVLPFGDPHNTHQNNLKFGDSTSDGVDVVSVLKETGVLDCPITNRMRLPRISGTKLEFGGVIELEQADGWISSSKINLSQIEWRKNELYSSDAEELLHLETSDQLFGVKDKVELIELTVRRGGGVLLTGTTGSGKTSIIDSVSRGLYEDLIYVSKKTCSDFAEERIAIISETFQEWLLEAAWNSPSVLVLEHLDTLIPAEVEHIDSSRTRQLCEILIGIAKSCLASHCVSLIVTSNSKESLHQQLIASHLIDQVIQLKAPDKNVRKDIIGEFLRRQNIADLSHIDMLEVAAKAEGYQPGDLLTLTARASHESLVRSLSEVTDKHEDMRSILLQQDFDAVLKDLVPISLRGANLEKSNTSWSDVGGLAEAKRVLLETLEWPTKYAPIFESCPLRLRSGILLYGYPGCGKTFLASAIARECGLNFISIKGPEILNKYIGASEKSVRDLFERAQAAKPCVLFFDEFDSIAPKRGHDSTGVTDRVVNQLLTQMDGAEGLDNVYVLAATSRPDLIDSALLRPGRIDKSLICDLPSYSERLDILKVIARKMTVSDEVDLGQVAGATEGFSGADLQAVMYNAHLEAIHEIADVSGLYDKSNAVSETLSESEPDFYDSDGEEASSDDAFQIIFGQKSVNSLDLEDKKKISSLLTKATVKIASTPSSTVSSSTTLPLKDPVIIRHTNMASALATTNPSISVKERARLGAIYSAFVSDRNGEMPPGTASTDIGGRATLM